MRRVCIAFVLAVFVSAARCFAADGSKIDAPPDGLTPSTVTPGQILRHYDAATGAPAPGVANTRKEEWAFTNAGLPGSETLVRSGQDYYARLVSGAYVDEYGRFFGKDWHRDRNGVVSPVSSVDYSSFEMLIFTDTLHEAEDPKNDVSVAGELTDPCACYVLKLKRSGERHPDYVYYDRDSGLVDRVVSAIDDDTRLTISYDDYRATKGLTEPWHIHVTDGDKLLDGDFRRQILQLGVAVDPADFAMPASSYYFASYGGAATQLPVRILWDDNEINFDGDDQTMNYHSPNVIVRLMVNGRGLDFALACGKRTSLIDWDVAQQLGLTSQNQNTKDKDGNPVSFDTVIPQAQIGGLTLHDFAVRAEPFHYHIDEETKIVGVLGYDVLSAGIVSVDFVNQKLTIQPAAQFASQPLDPKSIVVPVSFDDGAPYTATGISGHAATRVFLDNDFDFSIVFGSFTDRFPGSVLGTNGKSHADAVLPFADSRSYGDRVSVYHAVVPEFDFAGSQFVKFNMIGADVAGEDDDGVDAVIGGDVLRFYDLVFDYPDGRILLKPNEWFYKAFKAAQ